jgi:hypothetical protein
MTHQEVKALAGHMAVPPWIMKLVSDAIAIEVAREREALLDVVYGYARSLSWNEDFQADIRARGTNE